MALFNTWCKCTEKLDGRKRLWKLHERAGGREKVQKLMRETVRSHYQRLERIADDVKRLGYERAAEMLRAVLPQGSKARSGDLGEILATELVEERTEFSVPIRRLRYKDGREMALRGDDFIGVNRDDRQRLRILKGEAKSRKNLGKSPISAARDALNRDHGRCTPESLLFVADRLLDDHDVGKQDLGRAIRDECGLKTLGPSRIGHMLFTLSGNEAPDTLEDDWKNAGTDRDQYVVNLHVKDHAEFIKSVYDEVQVLGDD